MTMLFRWYSMVNSYDKNYADFGNGVGIQTDNLRTADTDWFRTKGAVNNIMAIFLDTHPEVELYEYIDKNHIRGNY